MPDAVFDQAALVSARKLLTQALVWAWRTVGIALHRTSRCRDNGRFGKPLFEIANFRLAVCEAHQPAIIADHNRDVIGTVEGLCAGLKGRVEVPFWRCELPKARHGQTPCIEPNPSSLLMRHDIRTKSRKLPVI